MRVGMMGKGTRERKAGSHGRGTLSRCFPWRLRNYPALSLERLLPTCSLTACLVSESIALEALLLSPFPSPPPFVWRHLWYLSGPDSGVPPRPPGNVTLLLSPRSLVSCGLSHCGCCVFLSARTGAGSEW